MNYQYLIVCYLKNVKGIKHPFDIIYATSFYELRNYLSELYSNCSDRYSNIVVYKKFVIKLND